MLVLLIIYAKRRESARFLRIQNNLQGILGKQALLTTHYGYTHYGYTYCGSLGNKQAPYSPLQPSYHPLIAKQPPLTAPYSPSLQPLYLNSSTRWRAASAPRRTSTLEHRGGGRASA